MTIQSFIFIHDQTILLDCIRLGTFAALPEVTYMFLGRRDTSALKAMTNVCVCRDLPVNIEAYPQLTSFSGWYAIWKNRLHRCDYLHLFEYDIDLSPTFNETIQRETDAGASIVGYVPFSVRNRLFIDDPEHIGNLLQSIKVNHGIDARSVIGGLDARTVCSRTSNHTFSRDVFERYMEWMEPMIDDVKESPMAGHHVERSISLFYLLNNIANVRLRPGVLQHAQANSHDTYPHALERGRRRATGGIRAALSAAGHKASSLARRIAGPRLRTP